MHLSSMEEHMRESHGSESQYNCDLCKSPFLIKWRFMKHRCMHHQSNVRTCHYYNNNKEFPFIKRGCKFRHEEADYCVFRLNCQRCSCQFKHWQDNRCYDEKADNMLKTDGAENRSIVIILCEAIYSKEKNRFCRELDGSKFSSWCQHRRLQGLKKSWGFSREAHSSSINR